MTTTQTIMTPPPLRDLPLPAPMIYWLLSLQNLQPLNEVDTSAGSYAENVPEAGLNTATGQSAQNREITYKKVSGDGNTFTLNGAGDGPLTLTAANSFFKIKSDGTAWWQSG